MKGRCARAMSSSAEREESAPEDVSDIIEEQERKRKRKLESQKNRGRD